MNIKLSPEVYRYLVKLKKRDQVLYKKIHKAFSLFMQNNNHPSLRLHKLSGNMEDDWSLSVSESTRMIFSWDNNGDIYITAIGTHDQVYD